MKTTAVRQRIPSSLTGADFKSFRFANSREIRRMQARTKRKEAFKPYERTHHQKQKKTILGLA